MLTVLTPPAYPPPPLRSQKGPTTTPREMLDHGLISKFGADGKTTQVVLLKLYKEYSDSAFKLWSGGSGNSQTVAEFVADGPIVKDALNAFQAIDKAVSEQQQGAAGPDSNL